MSIDLLLDFEEKNIAAFEKIMKQLEYQPQLPLSLKNLIAQSKRLELVKKKNLIAFSYFNIHSGIMNVDVLMNVPFSFDKMWEEREDRKVDNFFVNFVSLNHLIEMKKYSDRIQDQQDVLLLSQLKNGKSKRKK